MALQVDENLLPNALLCRSTAEYIFRIVDGVLAAGQSNNCHALIGNNSQTLPVLIV